MSLFRGKSSSEFVNAQLNKLQEAGRTDFLSGLMKVMYKTKGKDIHHVTFLKELKVWEFKIGQDFFYSSGPGWVYDYNYLMSQFRNNLGFHYLPKEGDVVIDVGAGIGEELMIFSKCVGKTGKVFSIEAHPETFKVLSYNDSKNEFGNTELLNLAIADFAGDIFINDGTDSLANAVSPNDGEVGFQVKATTIEELVNRFNLQQIDFMKVNIEGAEQLLIKGLGRAIGKIRNMAISCHDFRYANEGASFFKTNAIVYEFLKDNKFECVRRNTGIPFVDDYIYASSGN